MAVIRSRDRTSGAGFTLVELLIVVGIIALLISILLPAVTAARAQAGATACLNNVRQIAAALAVYANAHRNALPPNVSTPAPGQYWIDQERVGRYLQSAAEHSSDARSALVCPMDDEAVRSYAMNIWTSSRVDSYVKNAKTGQLWRMGGLRADQIILIAEAWSMQAPVAGQWEARPTIGYAGLTPGQRFGAGGGLGPPLDANRWGYVASELPYYRHRARGGPSINDPIGRVSIAYADGHAALKDHDELASVESGVSTLDSLWSLADPGLNR